MYNVIVRNIADGGLSGCCFKNSQEFDTWFSERVQQFIEVVEKDVTRERLDELRTIPAK